MLKGNEIKPLIIISSHDFHFNSHRIRSSTKIIECYIMFKWNTNPSGHIRNSGLATAFIDQNSKEEHPRIKS